MLAIGERLAVDEENEVTVDLPRAALGMLQSQAQDRIYYSVIYKGKLVTGYESALRGRSARVHVTATVHMVVRLRGAAEHSGVQEMMNAAVSRAARAWRPVGRDARAFQQQCGDHSVDINAAHRARNACLVKRLDERAR